MLNQMLNQQCKRHIVLLFVAILTTAAVSAFQSFLQLFQLLLTHRVREMSAQEEEEDTPENSLFLAMELINAPRKHSSRAASVIPFSDVFSAAQTRFLQCCVVQTSSEGLEEPWPSLEDEEMGVGDLSTMMQQYAEDVEAVHRGTPPLQPDLPIRDGGMFPSCSPAFAVCCAAVAAD